RFDVILKNHDLTEACEAAEKLVREFLADKKES
ncbi:MAG: hypothetical protein K0S09_3287, partial [Sphingobacteriaceae bacterium]|nr:hypothetical protein [Sphingobacteriaceae bacterium]